MIDNQTEPRNRFCWIKCDSQPQGVAHRSLRRASLDNWVWTGACKLIQNSGASFGLRCCGFNNNWLLAVIGHFMNVNNETRTQEPLLAEKDWISTTRGCYLKHWTFHEGQAQMPWAPSLLGVCMDRTKGTGWAGRSRIITIWGYNLNLMFYELRRKTIGKIADWTIRSK